MVFKRKNYEAMLEWKRLSDGKTALLIEAAKRIGKTTLAEEFAKREYEDYLILDFSKESKDVREQFLENIGNLNSFFQNIFLLKGKSLEKRRSVIIFDEVQLFPPARQAIKHLVLDGRFDYIETGSLIGIKRKSTEILIPSEEHRIHMYPMDFEEFLWAQNDTVTAEAIRQSFESRIPLSDAVDFISNSMIGNKCTNVTEPEVSLDLHAEKNNFKLFLGDTGLLVSQILQNSKKTGLDIYKALLFDRLSINEEIIFENMAAQMLRANGYKLFFNEYRFKTDGNKEEHKYEVDFLIVRNKRICPIEVKSSSYCSHESLDNFNRKFQIKTPEKFIIYSKNLKQIEGITCIPIYMTMCL
ncbi:MAG: ATP-binding protein [Sphaerochaetaceae bacterium]|nr:ATP-binding protein [Sphaerochaetaceae bacterium]MDD3162994.1 ATP-binding protein [Sphaerochaetaceae bacterium]MDD4006392.1 ATP-binding protein [Sphaerochaetaceae bacterium]MDD4396243.1 ATP-binding protein [Sphaerochaetaceae bacterium]